MRLLALPPAAALALLLPLASAIDPGDVLPDEAFHSVPRYVMGIEYVNGEDHLTAPGADWVCRSTYEDDPTTGWHAITITCERTDGGFECRDPTVDVFGAYVTGTSACQRLAASCTAPFSGPVTGHCAQTTFGLGVTPWTCRAEFPNKAQDGLVLCGAS